jgi:hypothetical protein
VTLSTWQLVVVGALATIWAVVLGVPLIVDLLRWLRNRPPASDRQPGSAHRQALDHFQQRWWDRPRPVLAWRSQDIAERRFQALLACGVATTIAMFLAIALRGPFVPVFLVMMTISLLALAVGAVVGSAEHNHLTDQFRARRRAQTESREAPAESTDVGFDEAATEPFGGIETIRPPDWHSILRLEAEARTEGDRQAAGMADRGLGQGLPDRSGFMFEPLNLDEAIPTRSDEQLVNEIDVEVPINHDLVAELGLPVATDDDQGEEPEVPGFRAAPEVGVRQASARARSTKRRKARPIYIESVLDEADSSSKAIND